jgi:Zn-dependent protease
MGNLPAQIISFLTTFPILIIAVTVHEFAHCWTSDRLGDDTPRREGRVTLNPLAHLDPMGTIMMVLSSFNHFGIGWGKPSPFNPMNFRNPERGRMLTAIAGPLSNIVQMFIWASLGLLLNRFFPFTHSGELPLPLLICANGIVINASLAVFNLLPVYPLDGHHVLSYLAPRSWQPIIDNPKWALVFLALVLFPPLRDHLLTPVMMPMIGGLLHATQYLVGWCPYV